MFGKLFNSINHQAKTITSAAIIIGALSLVSRVLGVFRDRILASQFGAGDILDVYYAAFRLPDLVFNLLVLGAISAGLIPVFTGLISKKKDQEAWLLINSIFNTLILFLIIVCAVLFTFAPWIMPLITPGFEGEKMKMVIDLSRIMFLSPIFLGMSAIFGSILQSYQRFFAYSLAPIFYNIGIMIGALYLVDSWGIYGLAWGVILGAIFHFLIQVGPVVALGYVYQPGFNWSQPEVRRVGKLMIPRTLTLVINQLNILVITIIASTLTVGSLSIFNLSNNLQSFPLGIFGISFAVAALPVLSDLAARKKMKRFVKTMSVTFRQILFFIVPISVVFYVMRAQIVRVILGAGSFDWQDTRLTAACLGVFALGLFAQAILPLLVRGFYALQDSKTPFVVGVITLIANYVSLVFFRWVLSFDNWFSYFTHSILKLSDMWYVYDLRVLALPAAVTVSSIINLVILIIWLRHKVGWLDGRKILDSTWRIVFASLGAGLATYGSLQLLTCCLETNTFMGIAFQSGVAGLMGIAVYGILGKIMHMEEMNIFLASFTKKFLKKVNLQQIEDTRREGDGV